jgi:uncharacterized protein with von Willebrand factor type A (vWA) domain
MIVRPPNESLQNSENEPARGIVEFCRFVRANGVGSGTKETIECLQALGAVGSTNPDIFRFTLRAVLCSSKEEWVLFDDLFAAFWSETGSRRAAPPRKSVVNRLSPQREARVSSVLVGQDAGSDLEGGRKAASGASAAERLRKIDFAQVPQTDMAELERVSLRLLRRMSYRVSRRLRSRKRRDLVDLRRTIRRNIGRGGELIELNYKGRKRERARLVILLDVSDSMNLYSLFLLKFAYVLGRRSKQVASFVFSTNLVAVSKVLSAQSLSGALETLSLTTTGWSGGTKIGSSLQEFNRLHAGRLLGRSTVFIILSDGWDTGTPAVLAAELRKIKGRVHKLIWLNPLLGLEEYEPITRGMSAARPYIDVFAPAHNLNSLLDLERHLKPGVLSENV